MTDKDSFTELFGEEKFLDPIEFPNYKEKYESAKAGSKETEGVICGTPRINTIETCIFVMESKFMMGSMGTVVGDRISSLFNMRLPTDFR